MSMPRVCPNCFRKEQDRYNFGSDIKAERAFHAEKWCDCAYDSPEEMMEDQDMPFQDPAWLPFAKHLLEEFHLRLSQGEIRDTQELVRFFMRLLKSSANNIHRSIVLTAQDPDEKYEYVYDGKTSKKPRSKLHLNPDMIYSSRAIFVAKINAQRTKEQQIPAKMRRNRRWAWGLLGLAIGLLIGSFL